MDINQKLYYRSNYWYNDGLKRANIRDMTGAVKSLKKSLKYNRENIQARNLLGLVYFGCGEIAEALVQWIISKNLKASENIANYYIKLVQETSGELDTLNQAIKKYNQCITYCRQGGEDLAMIQLQKVVAAHPNHLKAQQLLGLLYLRAGRYQKAKLALRKAHRLDVTNLMTLRYMQELRQLRNVKSAIVTEDKEDTVTYNLGNETIIQPSGAGIKEHTNALTLMNIALGILVGAAVIWFLIVPAVNQSASNRENQEILKYTDEIAGLKAEISALKQELEDYRLTSSEANAMKEVGESTLGSYETVYTVRYQMESQEYSNLSMAELLLTVNANALGPYGLAAYQELMDTLYPLVTEKQYREGLSAYESGNHQGAADAIDIVVRIDPAYDDGHALLVYGTSCWNLGQNEEAKEAFSQLVLLLPETEAGITAQANLDSME